MNSLKLYLYSLLSHLLPESCGYAIKNTLLRWAGAKIVDNVRIYSSARFLSTGPLEIGDDVHIGPDVLLYPNQDGAISIGSGSWLGARATILPGVTLPPKTIVAAGSVVTKSSEVPCALLAGVPANVKKLF